MSVLIVVCAWCNTLITFKHTDDEKLDLEVSHGMCQACNEAMMKEIG